MLHEEGIDNERDLFSTRLGLFRLTHEYDEKANKFILIRIIAQAKELPLSKSIMTFEKSLRLFKDKDSGKMTPSAYLLKGWPLLKALIFGPWHEAHSEDSIFPLKTRGNCLIGPTPGKYGPTSCQFWTQSNRLGIVWLSICGKTTQIRAVGCELQRRNLVRISDLFETRL